MDSFRDLLAMHIKTSIGSRRAFARSVGVSPAFVAQVISGKSLIPEARLEPWADALALTEPMRADFIVAGLVSICPRAMQELLQRHPKLLKELRQG